MKRLLIAALCAAGIASAHAQAHWNLATGYRAESFQTQNLVQFARDVERGTAGQLRIEVHPNNTLFKLGEIPKAVQAGKVEAGETIMAALVEDMPIAGADSIPFVVASYNDAQRMWQLQRPLTEKHFAMRGLKLLYAVPWPPQGLYAAKPIRAAADFKGTKMRSYNQSTARIAQLLGAKPIDVPMTEVSKALAAGQIDSMITSAVTGVENQVWGQIRYYYEINAWFPKNVVFVSAKAFSALKPAAQQGRARRGPIRRSAGLGPQPGRDGGGHPRAQGQRHEDRAGTRGLRKRAQAPGRALLARVGACGKERSQRDLHSLLHAITATSSPAARWRCRG